MQDESSKPNKDDKKADKPLVEGVDFYYTPEGYLVFTAEHHLKRGYCCGNGCRHCPYPKNQ
jgi:hypothetical protein